jgi:hypothetical protein
MTRFLSTSIVLVLALLAPACNGSSGDDTGGDDGGGDDGGGDDGGGDDGGGDDGGGGDVTPAIGAWEYDAITPVSNTCNSEIERGEAGNFAIDASSTTSFHVIPNDGTAAFTCTLGNAGSFDCPNRAAHVESIPELQVTITVNAIAMGIFSDSTHASGRQDATVSCAGAGCAAVPGPMPCTFSQDFDISRH